MVSRVGKDHPLRKLFDGLVEGGFRQDAYYGYWTLTAVVALLDPAMPGNVLSIDVSEPWHYHIRNR